MSELAAFVERERNYILTCAKAFPKDARLQAEAEFVSTEAGYKILQQICGLIQERGDIRDLLALKRIDYAIVEGYFAAVFSVLVRRAAMAYKDGDDEDTFKALIAAGAGKYLRCSNPELNALTGISI